VAEEAGVPLASASYHFDGIDDLIVTALVQATDDFAATLRADPEDRSLARLARLLVHDLRADRGLILAEYELYLLAARRPHLRPAALAWLDLIARTFAPELAGIERRAFQATVEGVCLHALLTDEEPDAAVIEATLRSAWPRGAGR
jgi:DNA-binding transcriptional regulator YbjK